MFKICCMVKKLETIIVLKERRKLKSKLTLIDHNLGHGFSLTNLMFDNCSFHFKQNPSQTSQLLKVVEQLFLDFNCRTNSSRT
jgi:hypothetical protein